jgi:hypothetical protein
MFSVASAKLDQVTPGVQSLTKEQLRELEHKLVDQEDGEKEEENPEDDEYDSEDDVDLEDEGKIHRGRKPMDPALHEVFTHLSDLADTVSIFIHFYYYLFNTNLFRFLCHFRFNEVKMPLT